MDPHNLKNPHNRPRLTYNSPRILYPPPLNSPTAPLFLNSLNPIRNKLSLLRQTNNNSSHLNHPTPQVLTTHPTDVQYFQYDGVEGGQGRQGWVAAAVC